MLEEVSAVITASKSIKKWMKHCMQSTWHHGKSLQAAAATSTNYIRYYQGMQFLIKFYGD